MAHKSTSRNVGRPREFDEEAALKAAMEAFWTKGYEATSMADLCNCTGLHKGSLYQAFGDKHTLFMDALLHYADTEFREVAAVAFESDSPLQNIRAVVAKICEDAVGEKGCLMVNTMVELAPHDPEVREALVAVGEKRMRFMVDIIGKAQQAGEIRPELDPGKLARQLMVTLAGSAAMVKCFMDQGGIVETVEDLIDSWA
jgi:TetR/AcrR family transcriptional repressor of nem operon